MLQCPETCILDEQHVSGYIYVDGHMLPDTRLVRDTCWLYLGLIITIHLCHGQLVSLCIQQQTRQTGNNFVADADTRSDRRQQVDTTCIRQHVSWCKRSFRFKSLFILVRSGDPLLLPEESLELWCVTLLQRRTVVPVAPPCELRPTLGEGTGTLLQLRSCSWRSYQTRLPRTSADARSRRTSPRNVSEASSLPSSHTVSSSDIADNCGSPQTKRCQLTPPQYSDQTNSYTYDLQD